MQGCCSGDGGEEWKREGGRRQDRGLTQCFEKFIKILTSLHLPDTGKVGHVCWGWVLQTEPVPRSGVSLRLSSVSVWLFLTLLLLLFPFASVSYTQSSASLGLKCFFLFTHTHTPTEKLTHTLSPLICVFVSWLESGFLAWFIHTIFNGSPRRSLPLNALSC